MFPLWMYLALALGCCVFLAGAGWLLTWALLHNVDRPERSQP